MGTGIHCDGEVNQVICKECNLPSKECNLVTLFLLQRVPLRFLPGFLPGQALRNGGREPLDKGGL